MFIPIPLQITLSTVKSTCAVGVSLLILAGFAWSLWKTSQKGWTHVKRLHQIPCSGCEFFTGEYRLKCTIHPDKALSEEAIDCLDYEPAAMSHRQMRQVSTPSSESVSASIPQVSNPQDRYDANFRK